MKKITNIVLMSILGVAGHAQYSGNLKVEELLDAETNGIGQKIEYPKFNNAKVIVRKITFPPGATTGWHKHEIPVFSYVIQGTLTVETDGHEISKYSEGECFAESNNTYHQGTNNENGDLVVIALYLGGDEVPLSIPK